ncbi:MAG: hypothetical protein L6Q35_09450 [Phycisphaerales bacterium]|nr:hypothetical protein [Phycisphaerales bacterium]
MLTVGGRALAWPLATQKPIVRDSVGWVALVTVFMGACMWAAVLLRDPQPFVPDSPPVSLVTEEGGEGHGKHGSSAKPAGKGSPAGGGAHGAAKAGSHGKKDDGHGAGAAPAAVKREPLIQRGTAKKPAKDAKKDAKKDGGHGGGH